MIPKWLVEQIAEIIGDSENHEKYESLMKTIYKSNSTTKILEHFFKNDKLSAHDLMEKTGLPEATVYRVLKDLKESELIKLAGTIRGPSSERGGPRTKQWRLNVG